MYLSCYIATISTIQMAQVVKKIDRVLVTAILFLVIVTHGNHSRIFFIACHCLACVDHLRKSRKKYATLSICLQFNKKKGFPMAKAYKSGQFTLATL